MLTAPKAEESVREAEARISDAVASGKCDRIAQLFPLAQQGRASKARCKLFKTRFEKAEVTGSERFGDGGAVIDYAAPGNDFTAILLLERDGLHHVAFLDPFLGGGSVGTPPAAEFGPAAEAGLAALAERNCQAFVDVASRRFGPGALEQSATCDYVRRNPLASLVEAAPDAQLQNLGGNADYAMYGFAGPGAYYVIVTGRESQDDAPASAPPLPEDAPEYAFIGAFRTNVLTGSSG